MKTNATKIHSDSVSKNGKLLIFKQKCTHSIKINDK